MYASLKARGNFIPVRTQNDFQKMVSGQNYRLEQDIVFDSPNYSAPSLTNVFIDGNGYSLTTTSNFTMIVLPFGWGIFYVLKNVVVENLLIKADTTNQFVIPLTVYVAGTSCINKVGMRTTPPGQKPVELLWSTGDSGGVYDPTAAILISNTWIERNASIDTVNQGLSFPMVIQAVGNEITLSHVTLCGDTSFVGKAPQVAAGLIEHAGASTRFILDQSFYSGNLKDNRGFASGSPVIGGLIGNAGNNVTISRSGFSGSVVNTTPHMVAGLIGNTSGNSTKIYQSFFKGVLSGIIYMGGLVAESSGGLTISQSFSTGSIDGRTAGWGLGGLVGNMNDFQGPPPASNIPTTISDSYSQMSISDSSLTNLRGVGGIVGLVSTPFQNGYSIMNTYFAAPVSTPLGGNSPVVGGITPANSCLSVANNTLTWGNPPCNGSPSPVTGQNNFWDTQISGVSAASAPTPGSIGQPTAAMQNPSNYAGWDFTNVWQSNSGSYPTLKWVPTNCKPF